MELLDTNFNKGYILYIHNPGADLYRSHIAIINNYAAGFLRFGYLPIYISMANPNWPNIIFEYLSNNEIKAVVSITGWGTDLKINHSGQEISLYQHFKKPVLRICGDYPFSPWVWDKVNDTFEGCFTFHTDQKHPELLSGEVPDDHRHYYVPTLCQDISYSRVKAKTPRCIRPYPFIYVGGYIDIEEIRQTVYQQFKEWSSFYDELIEIALFEYHTPIWSIAKQLCLEKSLPASIRDESYRNMLFYANQYVRFFRRQTLLKKLAAYPGMFILAKGRPPGLVFHKDAVVTDTMRIDKVLDLFYQAKSIVMSLPNFAYGHSERMLNAMHRGCVAISSTNSIIDQEFTDGRDYLKLDPQFGNLDEKIEILNDEAFCDELALNAISSVEEHHLPDDIIRHIIDTLKTQSIVL